MKPRWRAFGLLTLALFVIVLIMLGYIAAMGYFQLDKEEVIETVAYEEDLELVVENNEGDIEVDTWDGNNIEIKGIKRTYFGKDQLKNIEMKIEKTDVLKVWVVRERKWEWIQMDLMIHIPEEMKVERITAKNGHIDVNGIKGDFKIIADNGKINAENVAGNITLSAKNGNVDLKYGVGNYTLDTDNGHIYVAHVDRVISADNSNGWIHIHRTKEVGGLKNSHGRIWVKNCGTLNSARTNNGEIIIIVTDISPNGMDVRCNNGKIDITVPNDIKANYTIDMDNGEIYFHGFKDGLVDLRVGGDTFGLINGGGPNIDVQTDNGDVHLRGD